MTTRYLNSFYHYHGNPSIEDNVTRALAVTLSKISSVYQRLFVRDLFLGGDREFLQAHYELFSGDPICIDLQEGTPPEQEDLLSASDGVLVLLRAEPESSVLFHDVEPSERESRPDAVLRDSENEFTSIVEVKLGAEYNRGQLRRHFRRYFDADRTELQDVFVEISWSQLINWLTRLLEQGLSAQESAVVESFIEYTEFLGLSPFLGFKSSHFSEQAKHPLKQFIGAVTQQAETDPPLTPMQDYHRLDFEGLQPNLYVTYRDGGLGFGLVCGSESKESAAQYRRVFEDRFDDLRDVLGDFRAAATGVAPGFRVDITPHAKCYLTKYRKRWLSANQSFQVPESLDALRELFLDRDWNPHSRIGREQISGQFVDWLRADPNPPLGDDGLFPEWDDGNYLVTLYFHLDVLWPSELLTEMSREQALTAGAELLPALATAALRLDRLARG